MRRSGKIMGLARHPLDRRSVNAASWPGAVVIVPGIPVIGLAVTSTGLLCLLRQSALSGAAALSWWFRRHCLTKTPDPLVAEIWQSWWR